MELRITIHENLLASCRTGLLRFELNRRRRTAVLYAGPRRTMQALAIKCILPFNAADQQASHHIHLLKPPSYMTVNIPLPLSPTTC